MKITKQFLVKKSACKDGIDFVTEKKMLGMKPIPFLEKLIEYDKLNWANWLIVRVMKENRTTTTNAAHAAADAAAKKEMQIKILRYGIKLLQ